MLFIIINFIYFLFFFFNICDRNYYIMYLIIIKVVYMLKINVKKMFGVLLFNFNIDIFVKGVIVIFGCLGVGKLSFINLVVGLIML